MNNHSVFLKWLWLTLVVYSGIGYGLFLGFFQHIFKYDASHFTLIIYFIFVCLTVRMGWFAWKIDMFPEYMVEKSLNNIYNVVNIWNARIQYCGIVGTSLGMALSFQSFGGGDKADLLSKVGTSIYNIVVSMGFYLIIDIMCRHLIQSVKSKYGTD